MGSIVKKQRSKSDATVPLGAKVTRREASVVAVSIFRRFLTFYTMSRRGHCISPRTIASDNMPISAYVTDFLPLLFSLFCIDLNLLLSIFFLSLPLFLDSFTFSLLFSRIFIFSP